MRQGAYSITESALFFFSAAQIPSLVELFPKVDLIKTRPSLTTREAPCFILSVNGFMDSMDHSGF